ncbi:MAG: DegT/DnrJ/EryC1/StrS family aminotransferase [Thermodesulfobacteriota bacterium]
MSEPPIPFVDLAAHNRPLAEDLAAAFRSVLESGQYILGPVVEQLEQALAQYCGTRFAVGVSSGTDALFLAMRALGVGPGDEVITVPNTFVATVSTIIACGGRPVFVDVGDDLNMDVSRVEAAITPRTRAIIPVHLTGRPVAMAPLLDLAAARGIPVVEDAAQAMGALDHGRRVGSLGTLGCFSLHPLKVLPGVGDGGIITTGDAELARRLRALRNFGLVDRDTVAEWGYNCRLDPLQAALLLVKLPHLEGWIAARRRIAGRFRQRLASLVTVPLEAPDTKPVYQTFVIQSDRRQALQEHLARAGIETRIHYPVPLHLQPAARVLGHRRGDFPKAEALADRILSLPIYPELADTAVERIIHAIETFHGPRPVC